MALTNNPNRTKRLEHSWNTEISKRSRDLLKAIKKLPFPSNTLIANFSGQDEFMITLLNNSIADLIDRIFLGNNGDWQHRYQEEAFERSATRTMDEILAGSDGQTKSIIAQIILGGVLALPFNQVVLSFLKGRSSSALVSWADVLKREARNIVFDNLGRATKEQIIEMLVERVKVTRARARTIATTEITQASQRAVVTQVREMAVATNKKIKLRWITVADSRVRHLHASWHGGLFSPHEAEVNMSISPWNCRCGLKPTFVDRIPAREKARFEKERKLLMLREKNTVA